VRHFDAGVCSCDDDAVAPGQCDQGLCIDGLCCGGLSCSYAGTCVDGRSVNHCGNNGNTCFPCAPNLLCCSTGTTNYCALSCM
jgi:hypothetical protein